MIGRRRVLVSAAGAALFGPIAARAQQSDKMFRVGILGSADRPEWDTFRKEMRRLGYLEGKNASFEYAGPTVDTHRLPDLAQELVRRQIHVMVVILVQAALAAKAATTTIPIVFVNVADPVRYRLVASLAKPGGNITGYARTYESLVGKHLELLKELAPGASRMAILINPAMEVHRSGIASSTAAAGKLNASLKVLEVQTAEDLERAFEAARRDGVQAIHVYGDSLTIVHRGRVAELAAHFRIPAIYPVREFVDAGGLISYGPDLTLMIRGAAGYVDQILRGAKPGDLPVQQASKLELVINLKTARTMSLAVPPNLLARADEVIE